MIPPPSKTPVVFANLDVEETASESAAAPAEFSPAEVSRGNRQLEADKSLAKLGWKGIGVSDKAARLMESFEEFAGGKIMRTIDATHGAMLRTVASAAERMVKIEARMEKIDEKYEASGAEMSGEDMAKVQMLHEQWKDCAKILKDCNGEATKAAHIRVMMAAKVTESVNQTRNKKPAWKRVGPGTGTGSAKPGGKP